MTSLTSVLVPAATTAVPMTPELALVAEVSAQRVAREVEISPNKKSLFQIFGFDDKELICTIAKRIALRVPNAQVFVHDSISDGTIPSHMLTTENVAHFRNQQREDGGGAIVCAVPNHQQNNLSPTGGEIPQISEKKLLELPNLWIDCCEELSNGLEDRDKQNLANVFLGIAQTGILVGGLKMFARFVHMLDTHSKSMQLHRALDEAIPALRIPKGAGRFKEFGAKGRLRSPEKWAEIFRDLHGKADDALHLRNDRGTALDRGKLQARIADMKDDAIIDEAEADILDNLVQDLEIEPGNWTAAQDAAIGLKWDVVEKLVKTSKSEKLPPLGEATISFFENNMPKELSAGDRKILEAVVDEGDDADDEERDFFFRQRDNLKEDKRLLKRWERCVFRKTEEQADLALGLFVAIADLVDASNSLPDSPKVVVRLQGADKKAFWTKEHNAELCRFLRDRYRGLPQILEASGVICDFGMCWSVQWDGEDGNTKTSVTARQFKFDITIIGEADFVDGLPSEEALRKAPHSTQMIWSMPGNSLASAYSANMQTVANSGAPKALLASGRFSRAQGSDRFTDGRIDLSERSSIQDAFGRPDGALVDPNDKAIDVGREFKSALAGQAGSLLKDACAKSLQAKFEAFRDSYSAAVRAMVDETGKGLADPVLFEQAKAYGELLRELRDVARKDDCRATLWRSLLSLGVAHAIDRPVVAICTPWHPFKLVEAAAKVMRLAEALGRILAPGAIEKDIRTFSRTVARSVSNGWLPGVVLFPDQPKPRLLVETETFTDFGLMEPPTVDQGAENAFDGYSKPATQELIGVVDEFLELQPHERAKFSVVLYNADNRDLPSQLADKLARKIESEKDLRCDLILTHTDQNRLRNIYTEQNVAISRELDGALSNEATQGFLSRLRVGFLDVGDLGTGDSGVHASDIVFLHDVIARSAGTGWRRVEAPERGWPTMGTYLPGAETRRRYFEKGTRKTEVLLVSAERPEEVQDYLNLIRDYHQDAPDAPEGHFVPVREINFDQDVVGKAIDHAHSVGRWVVTYDAIADLQLFKNNNVSIIRFLTKPGGEHNLIVSTRHHGMMLLTKLAEEIGTILDIGDKTKEATELAKVCIDEAARISGRVVLRAARLENNALELLGLVLSKQVLVDSLPEGVTPVAWLLLDDYADWLGHRGQKADILVICLSEEDGVPTLDLVVIESKFVGMAAESACMTESMAQMRASTNDLRDRIVQDKDLLNRPTWLGRLADLLLEHGVFPDAVSGRQPPQWARIIRSNEAVLRIRGLSLVFVHDRLDQVPEPLEPHSSEQRQFVFNRADVAMGLKRVQSLSGSPSHA